MKSFLIFVTVTVLSLNSAQAGIVPVGPNEESQLLSLFDRVCGGGGGYGGGYGGGNGDGQDIGGAMIYCKLASGGRHEPLHHRVTAPGSQGQDQIVFVRPAPVQYDHNILVEGGQSLGGKTRIFVLPNQASHTVTPNVVPGSSTGQKPSVSYLSGNSGSHVRPVLPEVNSPILPIAPLTPNISYGSPAPSVSYGSPPEINSGYGVPPEPQRLHKRSDLGSGYIQYPTYVSKA